MAIAPRVEAAFFDSGGLKAGTPVAIASVPVSATAPAAKARSRRSAVTSSGIFAAWATTSGGNPPPSPPTTIRKAPMAIIRRAEPRNR